MDTTNWLRAMARVATDKREFMTALHKGCRSSFAAGVRNSRKRQCTALTSVTPAAQMQAFKRRGLRPENGAGILRTVLVNPLI
jgi:hypothetical protein